MTKQEYFDLLCRSARDGTFPSGRDGSCFYRFPGDPRKRCAIGLLIPDDRYDVRFEGSWAGTSGVQEMVGDRLPEGLDWHDLLEVQKAHDMYATQPADWDADAFVRDLLELPCFKDLSPPCRAS